MLVNQLLSMKSASGKPGIEAQTIVTIRPDATLAQAAQILSEQRIGAVVVSDDGSTPQGILSERDIVRRELPEVAVPELPDDVADYPARIAAAGYFEAVSFTSDDAGRGRSYALNAERKAALEAEIGGRMLLAFEPVPPCGKPVNGLVLSGTQAIVLSGTGLSCYREPKPTLTHGSHSRNRALNLESNKDSNLEERARDVENLIRDTARSLRVEAKKRAIATLPASRSASDQEATTASDDTEAPRLPLELPGGGK